MNVRAFLGGRRPVRPNPALVLDPERVNVGDNDLAELAGRAIEAGARAPLRWLGTGASAAVFRGDEGLAWKVSRHPSPRARAGLEDEAGWLAAAAAFPDLAPFVAHFVAWHPGPAVIARECVEPRAQGGLWWNDARAWRRFEVLVARMREAGWGAPEWKRDSWVVTADRGPVLVDAGPAVRLGWNHARAVAEMLAGRRPRIESWRSLAWEVRMEASYGRITPSAAEALLARLGPLADAEGP